MDTKKTKTIPVKQLYFDKEKMHYAITDSDVCVKISLCKGYRDLDEKNVITQRPEVKVEFERKWCFDGQVPHEAAQAIMSGQRPIKKTITTAGVMCSGDHLCVFMDEVIATLVDQFIENCTPVFGFKLTFDCLKGSQIEVLFNRAINQKAYITTDMTW